jgi:hypothetical protein
VVQATKRSTVLYAITAWIIVNIILMTLILLGGDTADIVNWIELSLWILSIPALLSLKKWGLAFTTFTFIYTLSTSVEILVHYLAIQPSVWPNIIRVIINIPIIIYLFRAIFKGKFK